MDLFVQHVGCADVSEVLYPEARHEVLAELEDVKLAATAEIVAFVQRVCGEDPVVSRFSAPLHTASACVRDDDLPSSCADDAESVSDCLSLSVYVCLCRATEPTSASGRWDGARSPGRSPGLS